MSRIAFLLTTFIALYSCEKTKRTIARGLITEHAMVVSARVEASKIGSNILANGGNAFDAMAATHLALAVAYPYAGNIGGGGFMVYRMANGDTGTLDFREKAPLAATTNMYLDDYGNVIPNLSTLGVMSVAVPGSVAGVFEVHKKFGSLPIEDIIKPSIELARKGVLVTKKQATKIKEHQENFKKANKDSIYIQRDWKENDTITYFALAKTLTRIMHNGPEEFYKGETAEKLVEFIQDNGGIITMEDLAKYKVKWRKPITFKYDNLNIITMAPPSSGGICLAQILKMIEPYDLDKFGHNSLKSVQVITEAERRAYADRSYYLGDPDFVDIPTSTLIGEGYINERMEGFSFNKATPSSTLSYGTVEVMESDETTHYSIIDANGNAISVTTTINGAFGSKLYCEELGFFLNNEMDDFSSKPGVPNMFGVTGGTANQILPEKRMLSSMTPTIVEKDGELFMILGTPGGSTIITSVMQTILNVHEYEMGMQEAVDAPRFHHQWLPDQIDVEPNTFNSELKNSLENLGYSVIEKYSTILGKVDGILILEDKKLEAGADHRGDDTAVGF